MCCFVNLCVSIVMSIFMEVLFMIKLKPWLIGVNGLPVIFSQWVDNLPHIFVSSRHRLKTIRCNTELFYYSNRDDNIHT